LREQIEAQISPRRSLPATLCRHPQVLRKNSAVVKGEIQRAYFELEHSGLITNKRARISWATQDNLPRRVS